MTWPNHQEFFVDSVFVYIEEDGLQEKWTTAVTVL